MRWCSFLRWSPLRKIPPGAAAPLGAEAVQAAAPLTGVPAVICAKLSDMPAASFDAADRAAVVAFYQGRQCRPLWTDEQGPTQAASLLIGELGRAAEWGLDASDFALPASKQPMTDGHWTAEQTAAAELELTAAALRYAHQAEGSRIPEPEKQFSSYLDRTPTISRPHPMFSRALLPIPILTRCCGPSNRRRNSF